jgi:excisionase family DNA binding protein
MSVEPLTPIGTPRLLFTPREAAKALSVCEKTLWSLSKRGDLPAVRIGRAVRYDVADLRAFIDGQKGGAR